MKQHMQLWSKGFDLGVEVDDGYLKGLADSLSLLVEEALEKKATGIRICWKNYKHDENPEGLVGHFLLLCEKDVEV
jgi:hypothetical protein